MPLEMCGWYFEGLGRLSRPEEFLYRSSSVVLVLLFLLFLCACCPLISVKLSLLAIFLLGQYTNSFFPFTHQLVQYYTDVAQLTDNFHHNAQKK